MLATRYWYIVIWYNEKKDLIYPKKIKWLPSRYKVGYENGYGHRIIYVVDIYDLFYKRKSFRKVLLTKVIKRLETINKKL